MSLDTLRIPGWARPMMDVFIDKSCDLVGEPLLRSLKPIVVDAVSDVDRLRQGGLLLLGAKTTDGVPSGRAIAELRRKIPHLLVYVCMPWDRATYERIPKLVRAGADDVFMISAPRDVVDLLQVAQRRILAPPPAADLRAIVESRLEGRVLRFVLYAFRNSQRKVSLERVAERWGYRLRTIENFVDRAAVPGARDLFRCGRAAHETELKQRGIGSAQERALRLGFDGATHLYKWKWQLKESAMSNNRLRRFAERVQWLESVIDL